METKPQTRHIEIELEELDEERWRAAHPHARTSASGSGRFRFTARVPDDPTTRFVGSPFTMPRASVAELADDEQADLEARVRLGELDTALTTAGWQDVPDRGDNWWSLRYSSG